MGSPRTEQRTLVELEGVARRYEMGEVTVTALEGADLRIEQGEFIVVLGPSGSGKTTLLNLIGALDSPTEGTIRIRGETSTAPRGRISGLHPDPFRTFAYMDPSIAALAGFADAANQVSVTPARLGPAGDRDDAVRARAPRRLHRRPAGDRGLRPGAGAADRLQLLGDRHRRAPPRERNHARLRRHLRQGDGAGGVPRA